MRLKAKSIPEFREAMQASVKCWYAKRGLAGKRLYEKTIEIKTLAEKRIGEGFSRDQIKSAVQKEQADLLKYPCQISTIPLEDNTFCRLRSSGLSQDVSALSLEQRNAQVHKLLSSAYLAHIKGLIMSEGHYAGLGTRLGLEKPKFCLTPSVLLESLMSFVERAKDPVNSADPIYQDLKKLIDEAGGLERLKTKFDNLADFSIGERIFIQKLFEVYSIAIYFYGMNAHEVRSCIQKLKYKIIINEKAGESIIETFIKNHFFQLDPQNVIFMKQSGHPLLKVDEAGDLIPDDQLPPSLGNHGLIPFQSMLDRQWYRILPTKAGGYFAEEALRSADYVDFQKEIEIGLVESVEDTTQLRAAYDHVFIGLIRKHGREEGFRMFMQIVAQKEINPQKGGFLGVIDGKKNGIIESDYAPNLENKAIRLLNRNRNGFYFPARVDKTIMESGMIADLHPTLIINWKGNEAEVRIDPKIPQGDRNLYVKTQYLQFLPVATIENLKDPIDIISTLENMAYFDWNPDIKRFARDFMGMHIS